MEFIDIMTWYNNYTNLPFKHLGESTTDGIDCFNLCKFIYKKELDIEIGLSTFDLCNIADNNWYQKTNEQLMLNAAKLDRPDFKWKKVTSPKIYDIILLNIGSTNITNHCAMYVDTNRILQIMGGKPSWVSPYGRYYQQYTTGIYRWDA